MNQLDCKPETKETLLSIYNAGYEGLWIQKQIAAQLQKVLSVELTDDSKKMILEEDTSKTEILNQMTPIENVLMFKNLVET